MDSLFEEEASSQADVNKMKAEIKFVTETLWRWVLENHARQLPLVGYVSGGPAPDDREYRWRFSIDVDRNEAPTLYNFYLGVVGYRVYGNDGSVKSNDVASVHATLDKFVEGMIEQFPELAQFSTSLTYLESSVRRSR